MSSTFASYTISPKYTNIFGHFELSNTWDSIVLLQICNNIHTYTYIHIKDGKTPRNLLHTQK